MALLRSVTGRHPDDVWANYELAATLHEFRPKARQEAARYFTAARALRPETAHALGHLLHDDIGRSDEALAVFADLVARRPHDSRNLTCYGNLLNDLGRPGAREILEKAVAEGRALVRLTPDDALAHRNLGHALQILGKLDESILELREAIRLEPDDPGTHVFVGDALLLRGKLDESAAAYREAIRLKADYADAHNLLGQVLTHQGKPDQAVAECREAIRLNPESAKFHVTFGLALNGQQKKEEAIAEHRVAMRLNPDYAEAHCSLGYILYQHGDYAGAAAEARTGQEVRCRRAGVPFSSTDLIAHLDRTAALAARLPAVVKGDDRPKDLSEQVSLADMAYDRGFYATAARLWSDALDALPSLGEGRHPQHRYNAACAAALVAAGRDKNHPSPDAAARSKLRRRAIAWLKAELVAWAKVLDSGNPQDAATVVEILQHWRKDTDLTGVRDAAALDTLPTDEQTAWLALWSDVGALLARARAGLKG